MLITRLQLLRAGETKQRTSRYAASGSISQSTPRTLSSFAGGALSAVLKPETHAWCNVPSNLPSSGPTFGGPIKSIVKPYADSLAMRKIVLAFVLALTPIFVFSESSLDDLSNDKVLEGAVAEIHSMRLKELEVAIEYIAACMEPLTTERSYHCSRYFTIASIKIVKTPQFSKLRNAVFLAELKSSEAMGKGSSLERIAVKMTELRRSSVFLKLQDAAHERYQKLAN